MRERGSLQGIYQGLSRRGFLGAAAGVTIGAALPLVGGTRAAVRTATAAVKPLAGATVNPGAFGQTNALAAAKIANGFLGMPLATTIQKIYLTNNFGTKPPGAMTQLARAGCQFLVSIKPSQTLSSAEQSRLAAWLTMMNKSGIGYRVSLWQECNDRSFASAQQWLAYWSFYAPVIQAAGVTCSYEPGCNPGSFPRALQYFPSNPNPDELWMDLYSTNYRLGVRLEQLIAMGQAIGLQAGIAEWGWSVFPQSEDTMTMPDWTDYGNYIISLAQAGQIGLGTIYYDSSTHTGPANVIADAADPRIPIIQKVSQAVMAQQ
jgi:hypothetical protein